FNMNGKNAATDDNDGDGLPDAWELACFPGTGSYNGTQDPDGDTVKNLAEHLDGTGPFHHTSYRPRLLVNAVGGIVTRNPVGNSTLTPPKVSYALNTPVDLTATPNPGYSFISWSGDASGTTNPTTVVMTTNKTVT